MDALSLPNQSKQRTVTLRHGVGGTKLAAEQDGFTRQARLSFALRLVIS